MTFSEKIKIKHTLMLLALIAITASIVPEFYVYFIFGQALILAIYGTFSHVPLFYVQMKEDQISNSNSQREMICLTSYFTHSVLFVIVFFLIFEHSIYFATHLSYFILGENMLYSWAVSPQEPVFLGIWLFVSGAAFVFALNFFTKLINAEEKIVIGDGTNE